MVATSPPSACRRESDQLSPVASEKTLWPLPSRSDDVEMHARAGIGLDGLGHETGGDAVPPRLRTHDPLQQHQIVGGLHHVLAVVQRQFVLARRILGNNGLGRNVLQAAGGIDVGDQRLHAM